MIQAAYNKSGWTELHSCLFMDCFFLPTVKPAGESPDSQMAKYCKILPLLTGKPKHREGRESRLEQFLLLTSNWLLQPGNKCGELTSLLKTGTGKWTHSKSPGRKWVARNLLKPSFPCVCFECFYWCSGEDMYVWRSEDNFPESFFSFNHRGPRHGTQAERQA